MHVVAMLAARLPSPFWPETCSTHAACIMAFTGYAACGVLACFAHGAVNAIAGSARSLLQTHRRQVVQHHSQQHMGRAPEPCKLPGPQSTAPGQGHSRCSCRGCRCTSCDSKRACEAACSGAFRDRAHQGRATSAAGGRDVQCRAEGAAPPAAQERRQRQCASCKDGALMNSLGNAASMCHTLEIRLRRVWSASPGGSAANAPTHQVLLLNHCASVVPDAGFRV